MNEIRQGYDGSGAEGAVREYLDRRVAIFRDGRRLMASPGYALDRALYEGWSTSQDTESSGRETESERALANPPPARLNSAS